MALNSLAAVQTNPKIETLKQITQILNYSASHPYTLTKYGINRMILQIYLDALYISEPEAHSRAGGNFFLYPKSSNNTPITEMLPEIGPVNVECSIMINFMASDTEAELGGLF